MSTPILATKLYIPLPRSKTVLRRRLFERLNEGLDESCKLTLVSAPAGFGKTTLVSEWVAVCGRPVAWLSLDEGDNDPSRFLTYLVAALQTIMVNIGAGVLGAIQSPQPPSPESILTALINEIATGSDEFILVLDDYHVLDSKPVDEALTFLINHLPPRMHVVIATREDPHLPLARLRARRQLAELRAFDLRFTASEAAEFLGQVMGLNISEENIAALEARTEGWIAGLQLAALSMQGQSDTTGFIKSFTGSHHFVLDYLIEEVLLQRSESIQAFLLRTSILDRLCGPLCDAVMGVSSVSGQETLEYLERANMFIVSLDTERRWYRYHHLFGDLLRQRLGKPKDFAELHLRASQWHKQNGLPSDAIRHALAAEDFEGAADMIELAWTATEDGSQSARFLGWAKMLPDQLLRHRPVLSVWYAFALLGSGEMEAAEARLTDAEQWLEPAGSMYERPQPPAVGPCSDRRRMVVVVNEEQYQSLPATIAIARAYHAQALGDLTGTVKYARRVLDITDKENHPIRGQATALLGITYWASGDLEAANRIFAGYMMMLRNAGNILDAISTTVVLTYIQMTLGRINESVSTLEQLLQFIVDQGKPMPPDAAELYRELGELYCERGDLDAAAQYLLKSKELDEQSGVSDRQYRLCAAMARIKQSQGDLDEALVFLAEGERLFIRTPLPDIRPISALKARIWVMQGRLIDAQEWAREQGLTADDTMSYLREFEHMTLVRVLIARGTIEPGSNSIHEALGLLDRLLQAAEEGGRIGSVIEILVLQARAHKAKGDSTSALAPLERALTLAEPQGYIRIFADEGKPMAELLTRIDAKDVTLRSKEYISRLLSSFEVYKDVQPLSPQSLSPQLLSPQTLVERLTERELEVLKLLGTDLSGPEIARQCMVSLSTIRTHTQNIFAKLGVNNRRAAVRRAEELDLF